MKKAKKIELGILTLFVVALLILGLIGPAIVVHDPYEVDASRGFTPVLSDGFLLGTDNLGRCELSRIVVGLNTALSSSLSVIGVVLVFGSLLGIIAGYCGGIVDRIIMWLVTTFQVFPSFLLAIVIAGFLGAGLGNACIALVVVYWTTYTRLARSLVMALKSQPFITALLAMGASHVRVIIRHIVPNIAPQMLVTATSDIGSVIVSLAGLAFLGLGTQRPTADWGVMLNEAQGLILQHPELILYSSVALAIVVLIFNLFGDALRDCLDR